MDGEEDQRQDGRGKACVLAGGQADDQDGERDDPGLREPGGSEPAHRGPAVATLDGAGDRAVRPDLDPVEQEPNARDDDVAGHRQVGGEEDGQGDREQDEVEVAKCGGHAGRTGDAAGSVYSERGQR